MRPPEVRAGEIIVCADAHKVGPVMKTLWLAQSITAEAVVIEVCAISEEAPGRIACAAGGCPVAKVLCKGRWSVRLGRDWVS